MATIVIASVKRERIRQQASVPTRSRNVCVLAFPHIQQDPLQISVSYSEYYDVNYA